MNIDLHCHSTASDGLLRPEELVARAAVNGVEVLALTDHDDLSGLAEARAKAEAFEVDELRQALRADAGIHRGDIAAHAVADEHGRRLRLEMSDQILKIGKIIREPVAVALRPLAEAETAPVGRDHAPLASQCIHHELERRRHVHPAVQHEELSRARIAPAAAVVAQAAHRHEHGFTRLHGSA